MTTIKKIFPALLIIMLLLTPTYQKIQAKDNEMENWLIDTANPAINGIVSEFDKTIQENWTINLSSYFVENDGKTTTKKLDTLRGDIKIMKKEVKNIKAPKSAEKEDKKKIKIIKKNLTKSLNQTDKKAKKLVKQIEKDKKIKVIKPLKSEQKRFAKVNAAYAELNNAYSVNAPALALFEAVKIDQEVAEQIIQDYNKEQQEIAAKKEEEKKKVAAKMAAEAEKKAKEEAKKKKLAEEKAAAEEAKRLEDEKKAAELAKMEQQKAEEEAKKKAAEAESNVTETFQNCTELRKKYPNGVSSDHPAYQLKMDRDKDNWACER